LSFGLSVAVNLGWWIMSLLGVYGKGRRFALQKRNTQTEVTVEQQEAAQGRPRQPPITTCLCIYTFCLVNKQVEENHEEAGAAVVPAMTAIVPPNDR
jgi:hypothetical protein